MANYYVGQRFVSGSGVYVLSDINIDGSCVVNSINLHTGEVGRVETRTWKWPKINPISFANMVKEFHKLCKSKPHLLEMTDNV